MTNEDACAVPFEEREENTTITPGHAAAIAKMAGLVRKISDEDINNVNVAKLSLENAQLKYQNFLLQLFSKYNLKPDDQIQNDGTIVSGSK